MIEDKLMRLLEKHSIVFWLDEAKEFEDTYAHLELPGIAKRKMGEGDFALKHELLQAGEADRFLIYVLGELPKDEHNFLLDFYLTHHHYQADELSDLLEQLSLPSHYRGILESHLVYFKSQQRLKKLARYIAFVNGDKSLKKAMLAAHFQVSFDDFDIVLQALIKGYDEHKSWEELKRFKLEHTFWEMYANKLQIKKALNSPSEALIEIFENYSEQNARLFLDKWRRIQNYETDYQRISSEIYRDIIGSSLQANKSALFKSDFFKEVEFLIVSSLLKDLDSGSSYEKILLQIEARKQSYWYKQYADYYDVIEAVCRLFLSLMEFTLQSDLGILLDTYVQKHHWIDRYYRQYHYKRSQLTSNAYNFANLDERVDRAYEHDFLEKINHQWSASIAADKASFLAMLSQQKFYQNHLAPHISKDQKIALIVSDALRYEIGQELVEDLNKLNRFVAQVAPGICQVPSFTQLGMAALLPHKELTLKEDSKVLSDGQRTDGLSNREKIFQSVQPSSKCFKARDFLKLNSTQVREASKGHSMLVVYSNVIDNTGDKALTESDTFKAVNEEIDNLKRMVKLLASSNYAYIYITADHGFVYKACKVGEGQKIIDPPKKNVLYKHRRFLFVDAPIKDERLLCFGKEELPYDVAFDVCFPRALNMFKVSGSGMQFLHGGLSLQELVIPFVSIKKEKSEAYDTQKVEIEPIGLSSKISTYQVIVKMLQREVVGEKITPLVCQLGFYDGKEKALSNIIDFVFDNTETEIRKRESKHVFNFSNELIHYNGEQIYFVVSELAKKHSNRYVEKYKKAMNVFVYEEKDEFEL